MKTTEQATRTLAEYLDLPYRISLIHDVDDEGNAGWVAEVTELPGCLSQGSTPDEAVERVREAMGDWISAALKEGQSIPEPREARSHSGRFVLRLPRTLHAELAREAEYEGVSLNAFATAALASAVGWPRREHDEAALNG
jgi:antitoxin HicB